MAPIKLSTPTYVLRGHATPIHALALLPCNTRLISGDEAGFAVHWSLETKRPVAVLKAPTTIIALVHIPASSSIPENYVAHQRDGTISTHVLPSPADWPSHLLTLPAELLPDAGAQPLTSTYPPIQGKGEGFCAAAPLRGTSSPVLLVPSEDGIRLHALPAGELTGTIPSPPAALGKTGMLMALAGTVRDGRAVVAGGYESGMVFVWRADSQPSAADAAELPEASENLVSMLAAMHSWTIVAALPAHKEPILSLAAAPDGSCFLSSGADRVVARHPCEELLDASEGVVLTEVRERVTAVKHRGLQALCTDGRRVLGAGWDGRGHVLALDGLAEEYRLEWHREGCYAAALAIPLAQDDRQGQGGQLVKGDGRLTVRDARRARVARTHWAALGSKDGKISLWDVP